MNPLVASLEPILMGMTYGRLLGLGIFTLLVELILPYLIPTTEIFGLQFIKKGRLSIMIGNSMVIAVLSFPQGIL